MNLAKIAKLANVSKSAVSMALNGKPGVSGATRARVLRIAREIGYTPRSVGAGVSNKVVRLLACVEGEVVSASFARMPFFLKLIEHIQEAASSSGYGCVVSTVPLASAVEELAKVETTMHSAGLILLGTNLRVPEMRAIGEGRPKLVVVDAFDEVLPLNMVVMNNRQGANLAAQHLLALGHRRVGYGRCATRVLNFEAREKGFLDVLASQDLAVDAADFFALPASIEGAQKAFSAAIEGRRKDLPTAIFCESDYLAVGVVRALANAGVAVPEQISVVGFDNIPESSLVTPELTTVHVAKDQIAHTAVERLLELMDEDEKDHSAVKQIIDTRLVERASTAKPSPMALQVP